MNLSDKEKQVIIALASEKTIKQIAGDLEVSPKTIEFHWAKAKRKLGIQSYVGATHYAIANGWVDLMYDN